MSVLPRRSEVLAGRRLIKVSEIAPLEWRPAQNNMRCSGIKRGNHFDRLIVVSFHLTSPRAHIAGSAHGRHNTEGRLIGMRVAFR